MAELKYEITEKLGTLGESANGWTKELNMVSWNDREPVYDVRTWSPDHDRISENGKTAVRPSFYVRGESFRILPRFSGKIFVFVI